MRRVRWLVGLGTAAAVWPASLPATAQCETSTFFQIDIPGVTIFYYDERGPSYPPWPWVPLSSTWIYEEANATAGLQRGGAQWLLDMAGQGDLDREICNESPTPDKLWY